MDPTRTTLDIIWSCIATLVTCIWVSLHLDMTPTVIHKPSRSLFQRILDRYGKECSAIVALLAPEVVLGTAIQEWLQMKYSLREIRRLVAMRMKREQRSSAGLFLLPIINHNPNPLYNSSGSNIDYTLLEEWTATHDMFHRMAGFVLIVNGEEVKFSPGGGLRDILFLAGRRHISLTDIGERIQDRSKADRFKKFLACMQTGWFLSQCIARAAQKLPITELEITIVGYVVISLLQYCFWWHKPQDVQTKACMAISEEAFKELKEFRKHKEDGDDLSMLTKDDAIGAAVGIFGTIFGGIHCVAWNFYFPTEQERTLWRVCSIDVTALPPILAVSTFVVARTGPGFVRVFGTAYVIARVALLVEVFLCLRSMPDDVHRIVRWTTFFPHI